MNRYAHVFVLATLAALMAVTLPSSAQVMPSDYQDVMTYLGKQGDYSDQTLKLNIPRNDLKITVDGVATPTPFGFGGWVAMTKGDGGLDVMMGDLVLLQEEVNPVMSALLDNGLMVTALHNHFFWEQPRIFYMHLHGYGKAMDLARRVKPALDLIGKVPPHPYAGSSSAVSATSPVVAGTMNTSRLEQIIGHKGVQTGQVFKITIGRDDIDLRDHGAKIGNRMGLNTWAAFYGSDQNTVIAGDIAMLESEVNPVLRALRRNGLDVVAVHNHMIESRPVIIFLHYWGQGTTDKLATGFRSAINELGKNPAKSGM